MFKGTEKDEYLIFLTEKCRQDTMFRLPDGYKKVMERKIVDIYEVPKSIPYMAESQKIAIETLDQILNKAVGTHFLEPVSELRMIATVKPSLEQNPRTALTKRQNN